jgi:hypothetical protein
MFNMEDSTDSATDEKGVNARIILLADNEMLTVGPT